MPFDPSGLVARLVPRGFAPGIPRIDPNGISIPVRAAAEGCACPDCGTFSTGVHSRRGRVVADRPWAGRSVRLLFTARRFFCARADCPRTTFAETVPGAAERYARRTGRSRVDLVRAALAVGAEDASRQARHLGMPVSADSLLRWMEDVPTPVAWSAESPLRAVAVDDRAFRKGHRYGTIVVDLGTNRAVALLGDRTAETLAAWLKDHPTIAAVARDRASAYAEGVRVGAPQAIQVADRWHLLKNLREHADTALAGCAASIRAAASGISTAGDGTAAKALPAPKPEPTAESLPDPGPRPRSRPEREASQAKRDERAALFAAVSAMRAKGLPNTVIARGVGLDAGTVAKWLRLGAPPSCRHPPKPKAIAPWSSHLRRRWSEGVRDASLLHRELRAMGYAAGLKTALDAVRPWRTRGDPLDAYRCGSRRKDGKTHGGAESGAPSASGQESADKKPFAIPSRRQAAWMLCAPAGSLSAAQRLFRDGLEAGDASAARIGSTARAFHAALMGGKPAKLQAKPPW